MSETDLRHLLTVCKNTETQQLSWTLKTAYKTGAFYGRCGTKMSLIEIKQNLRGIKHKYSNRIGNITNQHPVVELGEVLKTPTYSGGKTPKK